MIDIFHEKRNKELIERYLSGISISYLAKEYKITKQRVDQLLKNVSRANPVIHKLPEIKKLRNEGLSWKQIAKIINITERTIVKYLDTNEYRRHGVNQNEKYCSCCKRIKHINDFHIGTNYCKKCSSKIHSEKQYWRKHEKANKNDI